MIAKEHLPRPEKILLMDLQALENAEMRSENEYRAVVFILDEFLFFYSNKNFAAPSPSVKS